MEVGVHKKRRFQDFRVEQFRIFYGCASRRSLNCYRGCIHKNFAYLVISEFSTLKSHLKLVTSNFFTLSHYTYLCSISISVRAAYFT